MNRPDKKRIIAAVVVVEAISAALAYRDLARRPAESVRGPKRLWRIVMAVNPGNSIAYWIAGRRPEPTATVICSSAGPLTGDRNSSAGELLPPSM